MEFLNLLAILCATTIMVKSSPISNMFGVPPYHQRSSLITDSNLISFPEESQLFLLENSLRSLRAIDSTSRLRNLIRNPSMIIFDEDNDEPLLPEPVFDMQIRFPTTPGTPGTNQRNEIIEVIPSQRKPSKLTTTTTTPKTRPTTATATKPLSKLTTPVIKPIRINVSTTSTITPVEIPKTSTKSPGKNDEEDYDEILIEGSIYSPFRVHPPATVPQYRHLRTQYRQYFNNYRTFKLQ